MDPRSSNDSRRETTRLLAISGSLRAASTNTALLRAAEELAPEGVEFSYARIGDIPHYTSSLDGENKPLAATALIEAIGEADGLLIATPEFNYSIPGVLKNAIDWASRPAYKSVFRGKPVAIMSASPGAMGGVRAQGHLKQILTGVVADLFPYPEFAVGGATKKIVDGRLVDESTREHLAKMLDAFVTYAKRGQ